MLSKRPLLKQLCLCRGGGGVLHSTEVAYLLPTQQLRVRFLAFPINFYLDVADICDSLEQWIEAWQSSAGQWEASSTKNLTFAFPALGSSPSASKVTAPVITTISFSEEDWVAQVRLIHYPTNVKTRLENFEERDIRPTSCVGDLLSYRA